MLIFQLSFSLYILYFVVVSIEGLMEDYLLLNVLPSQNKDDYYYYYYYFIKDWCGRSWNMEVQFGTLTLMASRKN